MIVFSLRTRLVPGTRVLEESETPGELDEEQAGFMWSHIWSDALVYLRRRMDHRYNCYFAATFLSYEDIPSGDAVYADLQKPHEASCTRLVSITASTIWVIEGNLGHDIETTGKMSKVLHACNSLSLFLWKRRHREMPTLKHAGGIRKLDPP
ncbi:hypothetical protein F4781DRAFT_79451 [Annulohypoxylon bovei var. microspora]|nr:hypothetical protein F4781DRAFT_79451 [Annulohypoxylon bovei var. microspora]